MKRSSFARLDWILLCVIVLLAAWLRFNHITKVEFLWDQAEISKWALRMARQGKIAWVGPRSSTGLYTFPGSIWLLAIPYVLSPSPVVATGFIAALDVLAVLGCYFLARRWFGRTAAFTAALLFAVAPWAVIYSRKIWQVELLPLFTLAYVATGWWAFVRGRRWAMPVHLLALAAVVQIHFSAFPLIFLTGLWALLFWRRFDWRLLFVGGALAALTFVPYVVFDARHNWWDVHHLIEIVQQPATTSADALRDTWIISTGLDLYWLTGPDRYPDFVSATPNIRWLFAVEGGLVIVGCVLAIWRVVRRARVGLDDETAAVLMTATWLLMPALVLTHSTVPPAPHYFTTTFPAQFILIGWLVMRARHLPGRSAKVVRGLFAALIILLLLTQTHEITSLLRFVTTHDTRRGYGTPVSYEIRAAQTAMRLSRETGNAEVILLSEGDDPRIFEMPAVADVLMPDTPHRAVDTRGALVFPSSPAVYWATWEMSPGEVLLTDFAPEMIDERIPLREGARTFRFYLWDGGSPSIPNLQLLPAPVSWTNGVRLIGYRVVGDSSPGGTIRWTLVWQVTRVSTEDTFYHWFNHLLDGDGQLRGQADGPSVLPSYWRVGDVILNWFDVPVSADAPVGDDYTVRVGMYTYPAIESVPLLDVTNRPAGDWVEIAPIAVGQ